MLSVWVIFKIGDRLVDTCDALSGQRAVYWVGRSDSNSRATFFPQSAPGCKPRSLFYCKGANKLNYWPCCKPPSLFSERFTVRLWPNLITDRAVNLTTNSLSEAFSVQRTAVVTILHIFWQNYRWDAHPSVIAVITAQYSTFTFLHFEICCQLESCWALFCTDYKIGLKVLSNRLIKHMGAKIHTDQSHWSVSLSRR